jgi:tetratricopeptide (TPR) repeat protein
MRPITKLVLVCALLLIGFIDIFIYLNAQLYFRAEDSDNLETKIQMLEKANRVYPWNDRVFYALGKAYFTSSIEGLSRGLDCVPLIQNSSKSFNRALRLNPADPFCHFYYAQALLYEELLSDASENLVFQELKSAAQLAGENREIYFEVGKKLFARWNYLTDEDRTYVQEILEKALEANSVGRFSELMRVWQMNTRDVSILESIMPENPLVYRLFGAYLGEKSFSLKDRHRILSQADYLQYQEAKRFFELGMREYEFSDLQEAEKLFYYCLGSLYKIRFFHKLSGKFPFADSDFRYLFKSSNYQLARCKIESDGELEEIYEYLQSYLDVEEDKNSLREFESYLVKNKLSNISIQVHLLSKLGRYQEIVKIGNRLLDETSIMPDLSDESWRRIFCVLGEAYQKEGNLLGAATFYERSLSIDSADIQTLRKLRQVYADLNDVKKVLEVDNKINREKGLREWIFTDWIIDKDVYFSKSFHLEGEKLLIELYFQPVKEDKIPLISVELNGEVVWDSYLEKDIVAFEIEPVAGKNIVRIWANTHPFILEKIVFRSPVL